MAVSLVGDLSRSTRTAIEDVLGRVLGDDEQVSVMAFHPHSAPLGAHRAASAARLNTALDLLDSKAFPPCGQELEDALTEALDSVRPQRA
ncbi:MAG: hypothetical protein NTZ56_12270 [Acidobacteria bacterium]|nr:hypothetical protein [Acidobacteriota bacterium]